MVIGKIKDKVLRSIKNIVRPKNSNDVAAPFDLKFMEVLRPVEAQKLHQIGLEPKEIVSVPLESLYIQFRNEWPMHKQTSNPKCKKELRVVDSPLVEFISEYKEAGNDLFTSGSFRDTSYYKMWREIDKVGFRYNWYNYPERLKKEYPDNIIESKMKQIAKVYESIKNNGYQKGKFSNTIISIVKEPFENTRFGFEHKIDGYEVWSGHHRAAVLWELGFDRTDVMLLEDIKIKNSIESSP